MKKSQWWNLCVNFRAEKFLDLLRQLYERRISFSFYGTIIFCATTQHSESLFDLALTFALRVLRNLLLFFFLSLFFLRSSAHFPTRSIARFTVDEISLAKMRDTSVSPAVRFGNNLHFRLSLSCLCLISENNRFAANWSKLSHKWRLDIIESRLSRATFMRDAR